MKNKKTEEIRHSSLFNPAEPLERRRKLVEAIRENGDLWPVESFTQIVVSCCILGFLVKSKWVKRLIVKRYIVKPKKFDLKNTTLLGLINRPDVFRSWDEIVEQELSVVPFVLVEGYQGTGKSFFSGTEIYRRTI